MESEKLSKDKNNDNQNNISNDKLKNIKSNFILSKIYGNLEKKKKLDIVKYNKKLQNRLNLNIKNYKDKLSIINCIYKFISNNQLSNKVITKLLRLRNKFVTKILRKRNILLRKL